MDEKRGALGERTTLANNRSARWAFMDRFEVPQYDGDGTYLTRWRVIQTPWGGLYVHRFTGPDPRPTLHDHPWSFLSLVLRGGYTEATKYRYSGLGGYQTWRAPHWNWKRAGDVHTITRLLRVPTWTVLLVGPRVREWGYVDHGGRWTRFDLHPHNEEFKAALARRAGVRDD